MSSVQGAAAQSGGLMLTCLPPVPVGADIGERYWAGAASVPGQLDGGGARAAALV